MITSDPTTVEIVTSTEHLEALGPEWDRLVRRAAINHPFLSHAWIRTWWECFAGDGRLSIVLVRSGGELIAIAPLMRITQRVCGARMESLRFLANDHTPRCDVIAAADPDRAYSAIWDVVTSGEWETVQLREIPEDSSTSAELLRRARQAGVLAGIRTTARSPYVDLSAGWDAYMETVPPKRRWFLRNRLKRLSGAGVVSLETITSPADVAGAVQDGFRLEAAAWKEEAGTAIVSDRNVHRFYSNLAERCAEDGSLRLQFLKVGARRIAFAYCLVWNRRLFLLKPGFDPDYASYSPGNLLTYLLLQQLHSEGIDGYDLLGNDDPWKRQWSAKTADQSAIFLYANHPLSRLAHYTRFSVVPALKNLPLYERLRGRLRPSH